jgi:hypothetical protein
VEARLLVAFMDAVHRVHFLDTTRDFAHVYIGFGLLVRAAIGW